MSTDPLPSERDEASELLVDHLGARPSGQVRAGPGTLFREALSLLRRHGLRVLGLALLIYLAEELVQSLFQIPVFFVEW